MDKIKIKTITVLWHEGSQENPIEDDTEFTSFSDVQRAILGIYLNDQTRLPNSGYDKLKFKITWEDGEEYIGRLDMCHKEDNPFRHSNIIAWHCVDFLEETSARSDEIRKENTEFLAKYSFTD